MFTKGGLSPFSGSCCATRSTGARGGERRGGGAIGRGMNMVRAWVAVAFVAGALTARGACGAGPALVDVFTSGEGDYHTFRIPALLATEKGTLLAFAEGRVKGRGDAGDIDLVLKRSADGGKTWGKLEVVW